MPRKPPPFVDHVIETLRAGFGPVRTKPMFGAWGLWRDDVFFALVADDTLYLKVDEETRPRFEQRGLPPFSFEKGGELVETSYRQAPEEALENPGEMREWARLAYSAALRKAKAPRKARAKRAT